MPPFSEPGAANATYVPAAKLPLVLPVPHSGISPCASNWMLLQSLLRMNSTSGICELPPQVMLPPEVQNWNHSVSRVPPCAQVWPQIGTLLDAAKYCGGAELQPPLVSEPHGSFSLTPPCGHGSAWQGATHEMFI